MPHPRARSCSTASTGARTHEGSRCTLPPTSASFPPAPLVLYPPLVPTPWSSIPPPPRTYPVVGVWGGEGSIPHPPTPLDLSRRPWGGGYRVREEARCRGGSPTHTNTGGGGEDAGARRRWCCWLPRSYQWSTCQCGRDGHRRRLRWSPPCLFSPLTVSLVSSHPCTGSLVSLPLALGRR